MMTATMLAFVIGNFCQFKDPQISFDAKMTCSESLTNCSVERDGLISNKRFNECRERWVEEQRRKKK